MSESTTTFTTAEFFSLLARSELLSPTLFEAQKQRFQAADVTPKEILTQMLGEHLLTPFQAKQLGERRHRGFFLSEKYKILDFLGQGGMSRVLLCEHLLLQRLVAVKILNKSLDKFPGAGERFLREARASASMDHPNIARVFDVDRTGHGPCLVMEYVDGTNLHDIAAKHDLLGIDRVAHYVSQAATGLQQAHQAGLVHRDVKPANLVLDRTGTVKLLDLGLARFFDPTRSDQLTQQIDSTSIIGTADYIAPEQVMESSSADIRADIYSLGYTMYFLLTRTLPAGTGPSMRKLLWHQTRDPEPVRNLRPEIPDELAAILERMIKKKPDERYQTPAEVVTALSAWTSTPIARPSDDEMPKTRASTYRLGLCPQPKNALTSSATVATPVTKEPSDSGLNKAPKIASPPPATAPDEDSATIASSTIGYTTARDSDAFGTPRDLGRSGKTNPALSASSETDQTSGSSYIRKLSEVSTVTDRLARRNLISLVGMVVAFVVGGGLAWWLNGGRSVLLPNVSIGSPDRQSSTTRRQVNASATQTPKASVVLRGGGSTFVRPLMEHWSKLYEQQTEVKIEYSAVGSSKGVDGLASNFLDFGCTDAALSDDQLADAGGDIIHIPLALGAVVPTYNLTNGTGQPLTLRFTGAALANIYLGKIKNWNDAGIAVSNPGLELPDLEITVVHRSDGSGTTAIWTDYLSKTSSSWKNLVGTGNRVQWPLGIAAEKNDGVADMVSRTSGAIGYVEYSYALANGLSVGQVKNHSGAFVEPSIEAITAGATGTLREIPTDLRFSLTDAPGTATYPIVGTCWAVIRADQTNDRAGSMVKFLRWATTDGQAHVNGLHYGRLPAGLVDRISAVLDKVKVPPNSGEH